MKVLKAHIDTWLNRLDAAGMVVSFACAIHCMVFPLLLAAQPLLSETALFSHEVEEIIILTTVVIGTVAFTRGYLKHRAILPSLMFLGGIALIVLGHSLFSAYESLLMPVAGFMIAFAHFRNHKLSH